MRVDLEQRMDKLEWRSDATLKLVQTGMKLLVKMEKENREFRQETRYAINALIAAQMRTDEHLKRSDEQLKRTDAKVNRLIDALSRRGGNGQHR